MQMMGVLSCRWKPTWRW